MLGIAGLSTAYAASFFLVDRLIANSVPSQAVGSSALVVAIVLTFAFAILFGTHAIIVGRATNPWLAALRVHACNGFYIDAICRRVFGSLARS